MNLAESIAETLSPHLGSNTADVVARHLCAKYAIDDGASSDELVQLQEFLRRGLVAYVGADKANELAEACLTRFRSGSEAS